MRPSPTRRKTSPFKSQNYPTKSQNIANQNYPYTTRTYPSVRNDIYLFKPTPFVYDKMDNSSHVDIFSMLPNHILPELLFVHEKDSPELRFQFQQLDKSTRDMYHAIEDVFREPLNFE